MVKIKLRRVGARKKPSYRLVVTDSRRANDGAFISIIGNFDPRTEPETIVINEEQALGWLNKGAQPTETVARLLTKTGIMEKYKPSKTTKEAPSKEASKETPSKETP